jgi:hypothetical protein
MSEKLLQKIFKKLYGKPSWNVHRGYGSFVTFEFGKPKLEVLKNFLSQRLGENTRADMLTLKASGIFGFTVATG